MKKLWTMLAIGLTLFHGPSVFAGELHDGDYFPYALKGLSVYVYDNAEKEFFAGHVEASYFSRKEALSSAQAMASNYATRNNLSGWSYVCCTETPSSDCATKVK